MKPRSIRPTRNPRQIGSLPQSSQLQPDLTGQGYGRGQYPTVRISPVGPGGVSGNIATTMSVIQGAGGTTPVSKPPSFGTLAGGANAAATMIVAGDAVLSYSNFTVAGSITHSTIAAGFISGENETVIQTGSGASAPVIAVVNGQLLLGPITGIPDATGTWVGQTSGTVFTPNAIPTFSGGVVNANQIGTVQVDGNLPTHPGQILISQAGNLSALWKDLGISSLDCETSSGIPLLIAPGLLTRLDCNEPSSPIDIVFDCGVVG